MTRIVRACCLSVVAVAVAVPVRADDQADARKVIDKAITAHGGAAALSKNPATTVKMKGKFYGMGEGIDYTGTFSTAPDRSRFEISMTVMGQAFTIVQAVKADTGWMAFNGMAQDLSKEQVAETLEGRHVQEAVRLVPLTGKDYKLSVLGESKVDNRPAVGIHVEFKGKRDVNLFFDKETGMLVKTETRAKDAFNPGDEFTAETYYRDYKKVGDVMVAHKAEIRRDNKLFVEGETTEVTPSDKLDDALFAKP
jgi:hypothetical protein